MDGSTERIRRRRSISAIPQNDSTKIIPIFRGGYDLAETIAKALGKGKEKRSGNGWMTLCPAHDDHDPSLGGCPRMPLVRCSG